jgi:hypothetical protein
MTSIDYLVKEFSEILGALTTQPMQDLLLVDAINKAKEMHKQEIVSSYNCAFFGHGIDGRPCTSGERYYQETFKKD